MTNQQRKYTRNMSGTDLVKVHVKAREIYDSALIAYYMASQSAGAYDAHMDSLERAISEFMDFVNNNQAKES